MTTRQMLIRVEVARFENALRLARWAAVDDALTVEGERPLTSGERDSIDLAVARGDLPFDDDEAHVPVCPAVADPPEDDLTDLLGGDCPRCGND